MLKIRCDCCGKELTEMGALAFSPPKSAGRVFKFHVCVACWDEYVEPAVCGDTRPPIGRRSSVMPMWTETVSYEPSRPTLHEIAAQIYAQMMRGTEFAPWAVRFAEFAYDAAAALVAEGGRRDGI